MISDLAISEIERLEAKGFHPTPADIIRLNALALKVEESKRKNVATTLDYLPRAVKLTPTAGFRQPSIGHEIWFDRVDQLIDTKDYQTALAIRAFALSRPAKDLPDPVSADVVAEAVREYSDTMGEFCTDQIFAAIDYVINGLSPCLGERAPKESKDNPGNINDSEGWKSCIAAGILHEGQIALYGMTVADMEALTFDQLFDMIKRAWMFHGLKQPEGVTECESGFYAALSEIEARLVKEGEKANG